MTSDGGGHLLQVCVSVFYACAALKLFILLRESLNSIISGCICQGIFYDLSICLKISIGEETLRLCFTLNQMLYYNQLMLGFCVLWFLVIWMSFVKKWSVMYSCFKDILLFLSHPSIKHTFDHFSKDERQWAFGSLVTSRFRDMSIICDFFYCHLHFLILPSLK